MNILASPWATGTWQMAAEDKSVGELKSLLACTKPAGELKCLIHAFGSVDRCLRCFLRAIDGNAAKAAARIESTLAFRREQRLDEYTCRLLSRTRCVDTCQWPLPARLPMAPSFSMRGCEV